MLEREEAARVGPDDALSNSGARAWRYRVSASTEIDIHIRVLEALEGGKARREQQVLTFGSASDALYSGCFMNGRGRDVRTRLKAP